VTEVRPGLLRGPVGRLATALLLVAGTVTWRRGQYFSGSVDPVVAGKAAVVLLALALAVLAAASGPRRPLGTGTLWILAAVLVASVFGAHTSGTLATGGVVAARVALVGLAVAAMLRSATGEEVVTALARACGVVALTAAATGLPSAAGGRLTGGLPPLSPNELALLAGIVVLVAGWQVVLGTSGAVDALVAAGGLAIVWATGSRTGLLMVLIGLAVLAVHVRRPPFPLVVGGLVLAAAGAVAALATGALTAFASRDGAGTSTLESRYIAWDAARTWAGTGWQQVFGGGLSVKVIRVEGQWWDEQPLDSSWVSALVQGGILGIVLLAGWVLWVLRGTLRAPHAHRALFLGLLAFLLGRSVVESGLFDATPAFLCLMAVSLLAEGGSRPRLRQESAAPELDGAAR
jgi:O-antigen ligase